MKTGTICAGTIVIAIISSAAFATISWNKQFKSTYTSKPDSAITKASCVVCHLKPTGKGGLNSYGKSLDGKAVSAQSLKSVENKDADGDGVSNINEIKAGTLPGDANSKPAKK